MSKDNYLVYEAIDNREHGFALQYMFAESFASEAEAQAYIAQQTAIHGKDKVYTIERKRDKA